MEEVQVVKVLIIGDEKVGKSCILHRFSDDRFTEEYVSTIGVDFALRQLKSTGTEKIKKMQVWDTAGQERFRTITSAYYRGGHFVFMVYDITARETFENIKSVWLNEVRKFATETVKIALVGNKSDLQNQRAVSIEEAADWAAAQDIQFIECSAKEELERGGVEVLFQWAADVVEFSDKKLSPSLAEESASWLKKILPFFDQFKYYQPLVKITAPRLEFSTVQQWIALNEQQLTQEVLTKMNHAVHLGTYERKNITVQQAVYLYVLGGAIGCQKLSESAIQDLDLLAAKDTDIKIVPKLVEDSSVVDMNQSISGIISTLDALKEMEPKRRRATGLEAVKFEQHWREMIGRLYKERESTGDVTVVVEDKPYKAHKMVLVYNCDFFASCLMSNFKEADRAEVKLDAEVTTAAWESLLKYFYEFDMSHITDTNVCLEIISCAPYLMLTSEAKSPVNHARLLKHCDTTVYDSITDETAIELLLSAYQNEDLVAKEIIFKYIINNYFRLLDAYEGEFTKLPKPLMFSVLNRLIVETANK